MKVKCVRYGVTKNVGNYESERLDVEVEAEEGESFDDMLARAKTLLDGALGDTEKKRNAKRLKAALKSGDIETIRELVSVE
jgi:hypothetical protein